MWDYADNKKELKTYFIVINIFLILFTIFNFFTTNRINGLQYEIVENRNHADRFAYKNEAVIVLKNLGKTDLSLLRQAYQAYLAIALEDAVYAQDSERLILKINSLEDYISSIDWSILEKKHSIYEGVLKKN